MNYFNIKSDLTSFSPYDIALLADYYNIHANGNYNDLLWMLAIRILGDYNGTFQSAHMHPGTAWETYKQSLLDRFKRDRTAPKHATELPTEIKNADPTTNNKYLKWIITSYLDGGVKLFEDFGRLKTALKEYKHLLDKKLVKDPYTNINLLCGLAGCKGQIGLDDFLDQYKSELDEIRKVKKEHVAEKDVERIFKNQDLQIITPLTEEASCKYGAGTRWCTAGREENRFAWYTEQGPLYILIPGHSIHTGEKYQLHMETEQYTNEKNEPISIANLVKRFPVLIEIPVMKEMIFYDAIEKSNVELIEKLVSDPKFKFDPQKSIERSIWGQLVSDGFYLSNKKNTARAVSQQENINKYIKIIELIGNSEHIKSLGRNIKLVIASAIGNIDMVTELLDDPNVNIKFPVGEHKYAAIEASVILSDNRTITKLLNKLRLTGDLSLEGINFSGANLDNIDLSNANLERADFGPARLMDIDIPYDILENSYTSLSGANLCGANLKEANLSYANLKGANLKEASLEGATLRGASLEEATLKSANLTRAFLEGANLAGAILENAIISTANLTNAKLHAAKLNSATFTGANLTSAHLQDANLSNADLTRANLSWADFTRANLVLANFTGANLRTTIFELTDLRGANFSDVVGEKNIMDKFKLYFRNAIIDANTRGLNLPYYVDKDGNWIIGHFD